MQLSRTSARKQSNSFDAFLYSSGIGIQNYCVLLNEFALHRERRKLWQTTSNKVCTDALEVSWQTAVRRRNWPQASCAATLYIPPKEVGVH